MVFLVQRILNWWRHRGLTDQDWWRMNHNLCSTCGYGFDPYKILRDRYGQYGVVRVCLNPTTQHVWDKRKGMTVNEAHHYLTKVLQEEK